MSGSEFQRYESTYIKSLEERVDELEAENKKLKQAFAQACDHLHFGVSFRCQMARQILQEWDNPTLICTCNKQTITKEEILDHEMCKLARFQ